MKVFIDESGSFNWARPSKSTFSGVSVPDSSLLNLYVDFSSWKRESAGLRRQKEVKGSALRNKQLLSFVEDVVLKHDNFRLTYVVVDTVLTRERVVDAIKN